MKVQLLNSPYNMGSNSYLLENGSELILIDPSVNPDSLDVDFKKLKYIVLTHAHFDHMLFIDEWAAKSGAEVIVGSGDEEGLTNSSVNCYMQFLRRDKAYYGKYRTVTDGDELTISDKKLKIISTPGHTMGSISLLYGKMLFVGDLVFSGGGYGRCDLPGGNYNMLFNSIGNILKLDDDITVYTGHGEITNIKELKNYF
jgi:glyoxylase-like metal-dependent hydrolase (beta-lactamase superfamily II)